MPAISAFTFGLIVMYSNAQAYEGRWISQPTAANEVAAATEGTTEVRVVAKKPKKPGDREIYELGKEDERGSRTAVDELNKIPGVVVDADGNVTLRGRPVQLLLNGRPSLLLTGDNRAAALKTLPSLYISSIEVISTPGARYNSEGTGGIINLVTSRNLPPGLFGGVSVEAKSTGSGFNGNLQYHKGKLTTSGFWGVTQSKTKSRSGSDLYTLDGGDKIVSTLQSRGANRMTGTLPNAMANLEYELTPNDILSVQARLFHTATEFQNQALYDSSSSTASSFAYENSSLSDSESDSGTIGMGWTHYGAKVDEKLRVDLSLSQSENRSDIGNLDSYATSSSVNSGQELSTIFSSRSATNSAVLSIDYDTPVGNDQLSVGLQVINDDNRSFNTGATYDEAIPAFVSNEAFTDDFSYRQTLSAGYATYQREFGDRWTVLGGARVEYLDLRTNLASVNASGHVSYIRVNPSFYATYVFSDRQKLRLSATRRLQRPQPRELTPYLIYVDTRHVSAGNPNLRPQETTVVEALYQYGRKVTNYSLRVFYTLDEHLITSSTVLVTDPRASQNEVLQSMRVNYGSGRAGGISFNGGTRFANKIFANLDVTLQNTHLRTGYGASAQSNTSLSGSLNLTYMISMKDQIALRYQSVGKQLMGQGYMSGYVTDDFRYTRTVTPKMQLSLSASNLLRLSKSASYISNGMFRSRTYSIPLQPTFFMSLSRSFGSFGTSR